MSFQGGAVLVVSIGLGSWLAVAADDTKHWTPDIPKVWDEAALADWATPVAGLNVRPTHISVQKTFQSESL